MKRVRHRRGWVAIASGLAASILVVQVTAADSEFSFSQTRGVTPVYDGLKGNMGIRTDPATVANVAYVHITQADIGAYLGDFVAIGTANGMGVSSCADDFDPLWTGYYDYEIGGVYFCNDFGFDAWGVGSNPTFRIEYATCSQGGYPAWVLTFAGTERACRTASATAALRVIVGLEVVSDPFNPADRNIDVKYTSLKRNLNNGSTWLDLGHPPASDFYSDPNYTHQWVSDTAQNFYLAPLN
jgi:hypothetical protein